MEGSKLFVVISHRNEDGSGKSPYHKRVHPPQNLEIDGSRHKAGSSTQHES